MLIPQTFIKCLKVKGTEQGAGDRHMNGIRCRLSPQVLWVQGRGAPGSLEGRLAGVAS